MIRFLEKRFSFITLLLKETKKRTHFLPDPAIQNDSTNIIARDLIRKMDAFLTTFGRWPISNMKSSEATFIYVIFCLIYKSSWASKKNTFFRGTSFQVFAAIFLRFSSWSCPVLRVLCDMAKHYEMAWKGRIVKTREFLKKLMFESSRKVCKRNDSWLYHKSLSWSGHKDLTLNGWWYFS